MTGKHTIKAFFTSRQAWSRQRLPWARSRLFSIGGSRAESQLTPNAIARHLGFLRAPGLGFGFGPGCCFLGRGLARSAFLLSEFFCVGFFIVGLATFGFGRVLGFVFVVIAGGGTLALGATRRRSFIGAELLRV